ncbi:MAG: FRG domain-containing protein [Methylobacter sp.]
MTDTILIDNFEALHQVVAKYREDKRWVFRGHSESAWKLLPKAGRSPFNGVNDATVFEAWKRQAIEYIPNRPQNDWEWLAIAQHHGLATRLLDWTTNPLNAAFFAVRDNHSGNSVIYATKFKWLVPDGNNDPLKFHDIALFRPHRVVPRITRQGGLFSIHPDPKLEITEDINDILALDRIEIDAQYRETLRCELSYYGINAATLFPDLDGLSDFLNWTIESKEYWNFPGLEKNEALNKKPHATSETPSAPCG